MKLSKSSWHYKMITERFFFLSGWELDEFHTTVCSYFWVSMLRFVLGVVIAFLGVSFILALPMLVLSCVFPLIIGLHPYIHFLAILGFVMVFSLCIFLAGVVINIIFRFLGIALRHISKLLSKSKTIDKQPKPSLFLAYIKSKKDKVCNFIEWEE